MAQNLRENKGNGIKKMAHLEVKGKNIFTMMERGVRIKRDKDIEILK